MKPLRRTEFATTKQHAPQTAHPSPSPGGEGRGEGERPDTTPNRPTANALEANGEITRRSFLTHLAAGALTLGSAQAAFPAVRTRPRTPKRKKVAILSTVIRKYSHAQHFVDRCLEGYGWEGRWHRPAFDLAGLYVDQRPEGDLTDDRARRFGVRVYPTIEESLTLGGSNLAVDGVLIIGEHGSYPRTAMNQTRYPRHAWFKKIIGVFESSGRAVPVFNDKHLSTDWAECAEMIHDARRLDFPFLAGSSLPVTWRVPPLELPLGIDLEESVCVCYGGVDSYDFHGYETAQCMSERRRGGEPGIRSVLGLKGEPALAELRRRKSTLDLALAALTRSFSIVPLPGYTHGLPILASLERHVAGLHAFFITHLDGFQTTMILANGLVQDFTYAGRTRQGIVHSCQMHLPMPPRMTTLANFFNPLYHHIENLVHSGKIPYPPERTALTSAMTLLGVESLHKNAAIEAGARSIAYRALKPSAFWRS